MSYIINRSRKKKKHEDNAIWKQLPRTLNIKQHNQTSNRDATSGTVSDNS